MCVCVCVRVGDGSGGIGKLGFGKLTICRQGLATLFDWYSSIPWGFKCVWVSTSRLVENTHFLNHLSLPVFTSDPKIPGYLMHTCK